MKFDEQFLSNLMINVVFKLEIALNLPLCFSSKDKSSSGYSLLKNLHTAVVVVWNLDTKFSADYRYKNV